MKKHGDNTPAFAPNERVKVAGQGGKVITTLDDGRVVITFDDGRQQSVEPDKVEPQ